MATKEIKKFAARLKLENGTDEEGNMKYVSLSLGGLTKDAFSGSSEATSLDKLYAIRTALAPCLSKTVATLEAVETSLVSNS